MEEVGRVTELPGWVVPPLDAVQECFWVAGGLSALRADARERGVRAALVWLVVGDVGPVTDRPGGPATTWEAARAESWVSLCLAAGMPGPTARDWQRLGVEPLPSVTDDRELAYGAWRTLAWLLGVREDWPIQGAWHRAAGIARDRPHLDAPAAARSRPEWQAAEQASRDQASADAMTYWRHVRRLADATDRDAEPRRATANGG